MYYQKDYVLRMIEMLGDFARRLRGIVSEAVARAELDGVAQRACGLPLDMLRAGDPDMLEDMLTEPRRYLAAELLLLDAEVERRTHADEELAPLYIQALALFASLREPEYARPAADQAGRLLREQLPLLPAASLAGIAPLLEHSGQLALAEDALFAARDLDARHADDARAFLMRIRGLGERTLRAGGLSRAEVEEGLDALKR